MVTGQAMDLFSHLYPVTINGDYLEIRTLPDKKQLFTSSVGEAVQSLGRLRGGQNVHFGLCPRREPSGKTSATSRLPAMFVDFDFKDHALGQAEVDSKIDGLDLKPTAVVESGHGYHCYWRIRNKPVFKEEKDRELAKGTLKGFCEHVGGDMASSNVTSCPRVPGSGNHKYEDVKKVEIANLDDSAWYDYEDFTQFYVEDVSPALPTSRRPLGSLPSLPASFFGYVDRHTWLGDLWSGFKERGDASRSGLDWSLALSLRKYFSYSHEEIGACLMAFPHGKATQMPKRYLQDTVNRAVSYADSIG